MRPRYSSLCRLAGLLLLASAPAYGQLGIGTTTPNAKAALDIQATDKGLLLPRLTAAQRRAISAPPLGLTVFQTGADSVGYWYYSGTRWTWLSAQQADNLGNHTATRNLNLGAYQLVGNGGGTGLSISSSGRVGLGTTAPFSQLSLGTSGGNAASSRIANYEATDGTYFYGSGLVSNGASYGLGLWGGTGSGVPYDGTLNSVAPPLFVHSGGNVGIGTITPHPSAALDVTATNRGLLLPRLTVTQRDNIVSPAPGLIVFNTNARRPSIYTGDGWDELLTATESPVRSVRFTYAGAPQSWVVPAGVTSIQVEAVGASGGGTSAGLPGGYGGRVVATLPVTPGETLTVTVGGAGRVNGFTVQGGGGYNGGGDGYSSAGGGGGATDLRRGTALTGRIVVAGGGGGSAGASAQEQGACGGGLTACRTPAAEGGSQTAGGLGSASGGLGYGGSSNRCSPVSGGGGGGYYGGGAACGGAGGGGSSYTSAAATGVVHTQGFNTGSDGYLVISYNVAPPAPALSGVNFQNVPAASLTGTVPTANLPGLSSSANGTQVTLSLGTGNSTSFSVADNDNSTTNEAQALSKTGNQISLSAANGAGGGTITDADNQTLTNSNSGTQRTVSISGGNSVSFDVADNDNSTTNELQTLSLTGASLSLTNGGSVTLPDASATNELQTLSISGSTISLTNGGSVTVPSSADNLGNHTATQALRLNDQWLSNDGGAEGLRVDNAGSVGVGTAAPAGPLEVVAPQSQYVASATLQQLVSNTVRTTTSSSPGASQGFRMPVTGSITAATTYWTNTGSSPVTGTLTVNAGSVLGSRTVSYSVPANVTNYALTVTLPTPLAAPTNTVVDLSVTNSLGIQWNDASNAAGDAYPQGMASVGFLSNAFDDLKFTIYTTGAAGSALLVSAQGNVGVGVTPTAALDVAGQVRVRGGDPAAGRVLTSDATGLATWQAPATVPAGADAWTPNGSDLYATSAAEVGIGTTAPTAPLHINATPANGYTAIRVNSGGVVGSAISLGSNGNRTFSLISTAGGAGIGPGRFGLFDENDAAYRFYTEVDPTQGAQMVVNGKLKVTGTVSFCGGSYTCSDRRYKKAITPLQGALTNVLQLNGYTYFWRQDEFKDQGFTADKQLGFIAQEVEALYPEMVQTDAAGYKSVDYAKLTPVLVEAIKELKAQLDATRQQATSATERANRAEASINSFEGRLRALEAGSGQARK